MKRLLILMTLVISALGANAQNTKVITGAVIDKNGNPIPNALVEATGGAESVTTDADGSFRIEVPIWLKSLTAKYAGFKDKKIKLKYKDQIIFEMKPNKGSWFLDLVYSISFDDAFYSNIGLMSGFLGNWGGYAKVLVPFGKNDVDTTIPSFTVGAIKQVAKPVYLYLGAGYAPVYGKIDCGNYRHNHKDNESGGMFEAGVMFKFNKVNFSAGYSFSSSFNSYTNHSVQLSVGYCF